MESEQLKLASNRENNQNQQEVGSSRGQAINEMISGMAVMIDHLTVYFSHKSSESEPAKTVDGKLGQNPYRGLLAFRETDGDRFFGLKRKSSNYGRSSAICMKMNLRCGYCPSMDYRVQENHPWHGQD